MPDLKELSIQAHSLRELDATIEDYEERVKDLKEQRKHIAENVIPDMLKELKLTEIKLDDRSKVGYKPFYAGKPIGYAAYEWLKENGFGDIVKAKLEIPYNFVDQPEMIEKIKALCKAAGLIALNDTSVHHMTMGAFLKEQDEKHVELPKELFHVYKIDRAYVK